MFFLQFSWFFFHYIQNYSNFGGNLKIWNIFFFILPLGKNPPKTTNGNMGNPPADMHWISSGFVNAVGLEVHMKKWSCQVKGLVMTSWICSWSNSVILSCQYPQRLWTLQDDTSGWRSGRDLGLLQTSTSVTKSCPEIKKNQQF